MNVIPATVSSASPLLVIVDGSTVAVTAVALNAAAYTVGQHVAVVTYGRRLLVLGTAA